MTKKFPEAITEKGVNEGEILFLSKTMENQKENIVLMKATKDSVQTVSNVEGAKGTELPVYVKLLSSYIYAGKTMVFA